MKRIVLIILSIFLVSLLSSCSDAASMELSEEPAENANPLPATESAPTATSKPTDIPPTSQPEEPETPWPDTYFFCRSIPDDPEGKVDCQRVSNVEEWLEIEIELGDKLGIWPEGMPVPPLPEEMEWKKVRDESIGEYFWVVVAIE